MPLKRPLSLSFCSVPHSNSGSQSPPAPFRFHRKRSITFRRSHVGNIRRPPLTGSEVPLALSQALSIVSNHFRSFESTWLGNTVSKTSRVNLNLFHSNPHNNFPSSLRSALHMRFCFCPSSQTSLQYPSESPNLEGPLKLPRPNLNFESQ